ncbi:MAG TPA: protein translocase subunit SecF [Candidatus Limnocylindrales bacterium]
MFDVVGKKKYFFAFSLLITVPGFIFILLTLLTGGKEGLQFTIDYTGGTVWELKFADANVTPDQVKATLAANGLADSTVVRTSDGYLLIRTSATPLEDVTPTPQPSTSPSPSAPSASAGASASTGASASPGASAAVSASPGASVSASPSASPSATPATAVIPIPSTGPLGQVATALQKEHGPISDQRELTTVGAVVSGDLINQAILLIIVGSLGILLWVTFRFRDVKFGVTAIVALVHDVIVVVGTFAVLGTLFHVQVDALFVTAMLTIIGFSVHDTIVVFDRVRENKARHAGEPIAAIVNHSILQTFGRSINTSLTVVITLVALLLFGGSAITYFVLALLIGIVSGTYSSIFNAAPLVVVWQEWEDRRRSRLLAAARPTRRASA